MKMLLSHTLGIFMFTGLSAQPDHTYVRECDITFRTHIVRSINLRHISNEEIFGKGKVVKILLEAAFANQISIYDPYNKAQLLSKEALLEKLTAKDEDGTADTYSFRQLYQIEIGEDLVFDKQRSIPVYQVKYLTIFIPQDINYRGIHEPIATFRFRDCEKIFRQDYLSTNSFNNNMKINFRDVFLLHMYKAEIVKMGREDDLYFDQKYPDPSKAFIARKKSEEEVLEYFYKIYNPK
ncbi:MAG TPA: hypothetical protein VNW99_06120 [Cytophagaceae bacterium]|jgi:hypothetical protein|nr:hypothetical protein [Cytophagaceae bacterium]